MTGKKGRLEREWQEVGTLNFGRQEDCRLYLERWENWN